MNSIEGFGSNLKMEFIKLKILAIESSLNNKWKIIGKLYKKHNLLNSSFEEI